VVLHGLTGGLFTCLYTVAIGPDSVFSVLGSQESYVRNILVPAVTPVDQGGLGYRAVVVNFRGCMLPF
jgi:hypothetical protein